MEVEKCFRIRVLFGLSKTFVTHQTNYNPLNFLAFAYLQKLSILVKKKIKLQIAIHSGLCLAQLSNLFSIEYLVFLVSRKKQINTFPLSFLSMNDALTSVVFKSKLFYSSEKDGSSCIQKWGICRFAAQNHLS